MGAMLSKLWNTFAGQKESSILMLGLDAAGKTTILYKLKLGDVVTTIPTIGFNIESVQYKNIDFNVWDIGGQEKIRPLWRYYYRNADALVFVIDTNDTERIKGSESAKEELDNLLCQDELAGLPLLVYANKQDLPNAIPVKKLVKELGLEKIRGRQWYVQSTCAHTGDGLFEGMDWLSKALEK